MKQSELQSTPKVTVNNLFDECIIHKSYVSSACKVENTRWYAQTYHICAACRIILNSSSQWWRA